MDTKRALHITAILDHEQAGGTVWYYNPQGCPPFESAGMETNLKNLTSYPYRYSTTKPEPQRELVVLYRTSTSNAVLASIIFTSQEQVDIFTKSLPAHNTVLKTIDLQEDK